MTKQQRILFFGIGVVLGLMLVQNILQTRAEKKRASDEFAAKRTIPPMLLDWAQEGRPVYGEGVLEAVVGPGVEGFAKTRRVLVGGRNRIDESNRPVAPEFLAITEYYSESGALTDKTLVKRYEFAYADRIRVKVADPADTAKVFAALKSFDAHLFPEAGTRTVVTVRFAKPRLATVDEALALLKDVPGVVSAEPVKLDWTKEILKK